MHCFTRTIVVGLRTSTAVAIASRRFHTARMTSTADLPYKMHVTPDNTGLWQIKQTEAAAQKVSELLQEDMEVRRLCLCPFPFIHIPSLTFLSRLDRNTTSSSTPRAFTTM